MNDLACAELADSFEGWGVNRSALFLCRLLLNTDSIGNQRASCVVAGLKDMQQAEAHIESKRFCNDR
jgi:hypothetical protein